MLRVGVSVAGFIVITMIRFEGMGICITTPAVRLALISMSELGGLGLLCQLGIQCSIEVR